MSKGRKRRGKRSDYERSAIFTLEDLAFTAMVLEGYHNHDIKSLIVLEKGDEIILRCQGISGMAMLNFIAQVLSDHPELRAVIADIIKQEDSTMKNATLH